MVMQKKKKRKEKQNHGKSTESGMRNTIQKSSKNVQSISDDNTDSI